MMPPIKQMIAERLCNKQPYSIRYRLLKDPCFISKYDLKPSVCITIAGKIHLNQHVIIAGARRLLTKKETVQIPDMEGNRHNLSIDQGHIKFESENHKICTHIDNFFTLSPNIDERTNKLNELIVAIGPMAPDFSSLMEDSYDHELSFEQIDKLLYEIYTGVAALQDRALHAFETNQATLENLVPDSLTYYDYFCGPNPVDADPEEYLGSTLPSYRKELIKKNFIKGLDACLQGALRDDLMPGAWVSGYRDDEVWENLQACDPFRDPFALLGALDIAIWRQTDNRFKSFADDAIGALVKDDFPRADGIDVYQLMPSLAGLILNRINILEDGVLRPPYWKRMCAWMQAGFLIRQTQNLKLDFESLKSWISANMTHSGNFGTILDLRREPIYRSFEMTQKAFREEIVGRLIIMRNRHKENGRDMPMSDDIDNAINRIECQGTPICWALPGPLEGFTTPTEKEINLPEEAIKQFSNELFADHFERALSSLAYLSQYYNFGENLLAKLREAIIKTNFDDQFNGFPKILMAIIDAGFIAAAHRDTKLSCEIVSKIIATSPFTNSEYNVEIIIKAILIASTSFKKEGEWAKWLEKKLAEVAYSLPSGEKSKEFLYYLRELKNVLNLKMGILNRAEAIASAAI